MTEPTFDAKMLEALVCPYSQGVLRYDAARQELISDAGNLAFEHRTYVQILNFITTENDHAQTQRN